MNILAVYPHPDVRHGSERAMHLGSQALKSRGHRVFLLHGMGGRAGTAAAYDGQLSCPALFARDRKMPPKEVPEQERQVQDYIKRFSINLVHVHGYPRTATLQRLTQACPAVITAHVPLCPNGARYLWKERRVCDRKIGLGCLTTGYARQGCGHLGNQEPYGLPGFMRGMAEDYLLRRTLGGCARLIVPSAWMKQRLVADGMDASRIRVLHPAIADIPAAGASLPGDGAPVITFIGRLVDFKGPDHVLYASKQIERPHRIWFIGDGPMRQQLEAVSADLGLTQRVSFLGSLPPEEIQGYCRRSCLVVVPSLWPETFCMVGPEAMMMACPVVAYKNGGIPEWLQDGINGRLVEPGNISALASAIEQIICDPHTAHSMGRAGRKAASAWALSNHADQLLKIYAEALATEQS